MRLFWSIIAVLVFATAIMFVMRSGGSSGAASSQQSKAQPQASPPDARTETRAERGTPAPSVRTEPEIADAEPAELAVARITEQKNTATPDLDLDTLLGTNNTTAQDIALPDSDSSPLEDVSEIETFASTPDSEYATATEGIMGPLPDNPAPNTSYLDKLREARAAREAENAASTLQALVDPDVSWETVELSEGVSIKKRSTDGAYLVDNRHLVYGEGTEANPYEITWDMLYSVRETYRPRKGLDEIPAWTTWLNDKHVRITGFMATAVFASDVDELLIMKNEWDGCCIGVPPTPYDAVEVTLVKKIKLTAGMMSFGTIRGRLEVDPYLVRNWLVGLYLLQDATVEESGF